MMIFYHFYSTLLYIELLMMDISGAPFKKFASLREEWALNNRYISPGMNKILS